MREFGFIEMKSFVLIGTLVVSHGSDARQLRRAVRWFQADCNDQRATTA